MIEVVTTTNSDEGRAKAAAFLARLKTALDLQHADLEIERMKRFRRELQRVQARWRALGSIPIESEVVEEAVEAGNPS